MAPRSLSGQTHEHRFIEINTGEYCKLSHQFTPRDLHQRAHLSPTQHGGIATGGVGTCLAVYAVDEAKILAIHLDSLTPIRDIHATLDRSEMTEPTKIHIGYNSSYRSESEIRTLITSLQTQYPTTQLTFRDQGTASIGIGLDGNLYAPKTSQLNFRPMSIITTMRAHIYCGPQEVNPKKTLVRIASRNLTPLAQFKKPHGVLDNPIIATFLGAPHLVTRKVLGVLGPL